MPSNLLFRFLSRPGRCARFGVALFAASLGAEPVARHHTRPVALPIPTARFNRRTVGPGSWCTARGGLRKIYDKDQGNSKRTTLWCMDGETQFLNYHNSRHSFWSTNHPRSFFMLKQVPINTSVSWVYQELLKHEKDTDSLIAQQLQE